MYFVILKDILSNYNLTRLYRFKYLINQLTDNCYREDIYFYLFRGMFITLINIHYIYLYLLCLSYIYYVYICLFINNILYLWWWGYHIYSFKKRYLPFVDILAMIICYFFKFLACPCLKYVYLLANLVDLKINI